MTEFGVPPPATQPVPTASVAPEQQIELLYEELVVVGEGVAEQGERLGERAPTDHELRALTRH